MMLDIFSSFDPFINSHYSNNPSLFWISSFTVLILINTTLWTSPSKSFWSMTLLADIMNTQSNRTMGKHLKGFSSIISALFLVLILSNFIGLLPYSFSMSSHLIMTLVLGLPLWLSLIISGALHAPKSFTASLLPSGAPDWLNPFLVLVESLSILMRPITLSFRLAANMTAGHVILSLVGVYTASTLLTNFSSFTLLLLTQTGYIMFEVGICLIQAYIFCLLISLYADEHATNQ